MHEQMIQQLWRLWRRTALVLLIVVATSVSALSDVVQAGMEGPLNNGSFEQGFLELSGCSNMNESTQRMVGKGWGCFTNRGAANYGFYADQWGPVVADGQFSQLIEINTWDFVNSDNDRYSGIFQSVPVMPGAVYRFRMRGMIRTTNFDGDKWRYQVQVGYLEGTAKDWRDVTNWTDVGWNTYYPRLEPGAFSEFQINIRPESDRLTLFIRLWKKWGTTNEEIDLNLDSIGLENLGVPKPPGNPKQPGYPKPPGEPGK